MMVGKPKALISVTKLHTFHIVTEKSNLTFEFACIHGMMIACAHMLCVSDESRKEDLVTRRLWEKSNMERYIADTRKESKRRR